MRSSFRKFRKILFWRHPNSLPHQLVPPHWRINNPPMLGGVMDAFATVFTSWSSVKSRTWTVRFRCSSVRWTAWRMGSQDGRIRGENNHGDRCCPLRIGLWDPFQMAELKMAAIHGGVILTSYKSWDDPPSSSPESRMSGWTRRSSGDEASSWCSLPSFSEVIKNGPNVFLRWIETIYTM